MESTEIIIDGKVNAIPEQCLRCDLSCASSCHSIGPKGCNVCRAGYYWDNDTGCIDIDECNLMELNPCKYNTYCINTQGSFKCFRKCLLHYIGFCFKNEITTDTFSKFLASKNM